MTNSSKQSNLTHDRLVVKNFGPIKSLDIEIKPLTIFIGESGSGKSAILKLMSLLRWVHKQNNLRSFFVKSKLATKSDYSRLVSSTLLKMSGLEEFVTAQTEIEFTVGHTLYQSKAKLPTDAKLSSQDGLCAEKIAFISENRGVLPDIYSNKIPRGFKLPYYLGDTYENFLEAFDKLDAKEFLIESTDLSLFRKTGVAAQFFVKNNNDKESSEGFELKLENASSGTKTALFSEIIVDHLTQRFDFKTVFDGAFKEFFMSKLLAQEDNAFSNKDNLPKIRFGKRHLSIYIEEPELSLFPTAQKRLIQRLIKSCFNSEASELKETKLAFATHSPYILSVINNLVMAADLSKDQPNKSERIRQIIPEEYWLLSDKLGVYSIENGIAHSIMDEETRLINADYLDSVSESINDDFSKLIDLRYFDETDLEVED